MRLLVLLIALSLLVAVSQAIVCAPNYCAAVDCVSVTDCNGIVVPNSSFCGCCSVCKTVLQPGQTCIQLFLMGMPTTVMCPANHHCDSATLTCVPSA